MDLFTGQLFEEFVETKILKIPQVKESMLSLLGAIPEYLFKLEFSGLPAEMSDSFDEDLRGLFLVPMWLLEQSHLRKHEILSVFIDFLLQVLDGKTDLKSNSTCFSGDQNRIDVLSKELRFLLIVLGDKGLLSGEVEEEGNLMAEFEAVANEAGRLIYSFLIYSTNEDNDSVIRMGALFEHIGLLEAILRNFLTLISCNSKTRNQARNTASVHSLYVVDSLIHDLQGLIDREDDWIVDDVKGQMKMLHQELMLSQFLLKEISLPRNSEILETKAIMIRIRDLAFEAEYLINSFLVGDAPVWYLAIRLTDVIDKVKFGGDEMKRIKKNHDVGALHVAKDHSAKLSLQRRRNSDVVDDIIIGFDDGEIEILDHLVRGTERLQVVSIFGMPGLGKTTLAKKLYRNPIVSYHFDKCSWCAVSQTYDRKSILIDILRSLTNELNKQKLLDMKEESLAEQIYRSLKGRRYIIVIDDIWDSNVWDDLRRSFPDDATGSRILFTTRNKDVAPPNSINYALPSLSVDQCWELLEKKVFHHRACPPQLLGLGKEIAGNCNGLPLAVVVIAGILSTMEKEESAWKNVGEMLNSYIFSDQNNAVMQILKLSYKHLPEYIKPCFLYFGVFPKGREIHVKKLTRLWIAEGFICKEEEKSAESIADKYLLELTDKSLVMVSKRRSDGGAKACTVHDLLHDMCLKIAEEENFLKTTYINGSIYTNHQRLYANFIPCYLLPFGFQVRSIFGSNTDSSRYVLKMKSLRVVDLPYTTLKHGDGIKRLAQLRYLVTKSMPLSSIANLVNLECLTINTRRLHLDFIFTVIHQNPKLRYLNAPLLENSGRDCTPLKTNNLEYISSFSIQKPKDENILECAPHLRTLKCICYPFLDEDGLYRYPDLRFLTRLESLYMSGDHLQHDIAEINLPTNLKKLTLSHLHLPWEKASVIGGLSNLQALKLRSHAFVGERWETKDGEFQQLRFLQLASLDFTHWNVTSREHFPELQQLVLLGCDNLDEIPCEIGYIAMLQMIKVVLCAEAVAESAKEIQQEQVDMGNEELKVIIF